MYKCANNVRVKCFQSWFKFEPNFMLFCRKSKLCRDFALFGVIVWYILEIDVTFCTIWVFWAFYAVMQIHFCRNLITFFG